jgi:hypothetical protein
MSPPGLACMLLCCCWHASSRCVWRRGKGHVPYKYLYDHVRKRFVCKCIARPLHFLSLSDELPNEFAILLGKQGVTTPFVLMNCYVSMLRYSDVSHWSGGLSLRQTAQFALSSGSQEIPLTGSCGAGRCRITTLIMVSKLFPTAVPSTLLETSWKGQDGVFRTHERTCDCTCARGPASR